MRNINTTIYDHQYSWWSDANSVYQATFLPSLRPGIEASECDTFSYTYLIDV